jgi:hypothetical protein
VQNIDAELFEYVQGIYRLADVPLNDSNTVTLQQFMSWFLQSKEPIQAVQQTIEVC